MSDDRPWPVEISPVGPVSAATVLWRRNGKLRVTVIVKATFAFVPGGTMTQVEPAAIHRIEQHHGNNPMRSVRAPSDLAPVLESAELIFAGHAHAPPDSPAPSVPIRLAVRRDGEALVDKKLIVSGNRAPPARGQKAPEPTRFQRMPLTAERAFGGLGSPDNPVGTGYGSDPGRLMPNLVDPARGPEHTAGLGPISCHFPPRKRLLHGQDRKKLDGRIMELSPDLDLRYFHAAPEDQRLPFLHGDEQILLEGLHPVHARLETRLPGARGQARIYAPDGVELSLALNADTLFIDGDQERASVVWRGSCLVTHEEALDGVTILAGIELAGRPIVWPTFHERSHVRASAPGRPPSSLPPPLDFAHTEVLDDDDLVSEPAEKATDTLPLGMFLADLPAPPRPVEKDTETRPRWRDTLVLETTNDDDDDDGTATMTLLGAPFTIPEPGSSRPGAAPAPLPGAPWTPIPAKAPARPKLAATLPVNAQDWTRTRADLPLDEPSSLRAPFPIARPSSGGAPAAAAPLPGAPWAPGSAVEVPPLDASDETATLELRPAKKARAPEAAPASEAAPRSDTAPAPASAPLAASADKPPAPEPSAPANESAKAPSWSWATVAPAEKQVVSPASPAARPPPEPRPAVKNSIYGKFGAKK